MSTVDCSRSAWNFLIRKEAPSSGAEARSFKSESDRLLGIAPRLLPVSAEDSVMLGSSTWRGMDEVSDLRNCGAVPGDFVFGGGLAFVGGGKAAPLTCFICPGN